MRELILENPLLLEFKRNIRKFLLMGKGRSAYLAVYILFGTVYASLLLIVYSVRQDVPSVAFMYTNLVVQTLIIPAIMHAAIAGEREKRSWDMLLVAPISNRQIVFGKFISGISVAFLIYGAFLPMAAIVMPFDESPTTLSVIGGQVLTSVTWSAFVTALSLFISSRCFRAFTANFIIYGTLFALLIVVPIFLSVAIRGPEDTSLFSFFHPFWTMHGIIDQATSASPERLHAGYGIFQSIAYSAAAYALLVFTEGSFRSIDQRVGD